MSTLHIALATTCAIILFLYAIDNFSKEIQQVSGENFRKFLTKGTRHPLLGLLLGAGVTSVIQSSTATSVIAVGLVNAGMLSFKNSLGVIFGANIGTTVTAQLVAFKLTDVAPAFIVLGFILSLVRSKFRFIGKSIFFFGFVFFSLNLISASVKPLQSDPTLLQHLASASDPLVGVFIGALFTALVQSSSVTTGLAVVMLQNDLMTFDAALPVILGANIGTTVTALLASMNMDTAGKRTALSHFIYNVVGAVVFLPLVLQIPGYIEITKENASHTLANVHLAFNLATAILFVSFVTPYSKLLQRLLPSKEDELVHTINLVDLKQNPTAPNGLASLDRASIDLLSLLSRNYNLVTLALETKEEAMLKRCIKNQSTIALIKGEIQDFVNQLSPYIENEKQSLELIHLVNRVDYLYQISDSIEDLIQLNEKMNERQAPLSPEIIMRFRDMASSILKIFEAAIDESKPQKIQKAKFTKVIHAYGTTVNETYGMLLKDLAIQADRNSVHLARFVSLNQRIKDKISAFYKLAHPSLTLR